MTLAPSDSLFRALEALERSGKEISFVCDADRRLLGTLTDGDARRALLGGATLSETLVDEVMSRTFTFVRAEAPRAEVLDMMRAQRIGQVPVLDREGRLIGLHTLHEIVGAVERPNAAVIMAGGKGTRLRPYTETVPKPMMKVAGRPMLERLILHLVGYGIRDIRLSVNYLAHVVEDYFQDGRNFGCSIRYIRETEPLGTGGCLSLLDEPPSHSLLVMNGDLVTQADIGRMLEFHEEGEYLGTMGVRPHLVNIPFGVAEVEGARLVGIREKPTEEFLVNAGMYVLSPELVELVPSGRDFPITDLFQRCVDERRPVGAFLITDDWVDVGKPEELLRANGRI